MPPVNTRLDIQLVGRNETTFTSRVKEMPSTAGITDYPGKGSWGRLPLLLFSLCYKGCIWTTELSIEAQNISWHVISALCLLGLLWGLTLSIPHQQIHHLFGTMGGISSSCVILPYTKVDCLIMQILQNSKKCHKTVQLSAIYSLACTLP